MRLVEAVSSAASQKRRPQVCLASPLRWSSFVKHAGRTGVCAGERGGSRTR